MRSRLWQTGLYTLMAGLIAACNINLPEPIITPTIEVLISETPTIEPSLTPTPSPSPTTGPEVPVLIATPIPVSTEAVGVVDSIPTETPGPWTYTIQEGDTMGIIMQREPWRYPAFDPAVINAIIAINTNIVNADILPPIGSEILIPQRTPTPIPEGIELTRAVDQQLGVQRFGSVVLAEGATTGCHDVLENETIVGIADLYDTTLEVISQFNQTLNWAGCDFTQYSGGPGCGPFISIGQCVVVPLPTPTVAPTSTPSGQETPTPTPTYPAANAVSPAEGAIAPAGVFPLQWVSVGILKPDEVYLVEVQDLNAATQWNEVTRNTTIMLPERLIPTSGTTHIMQWRVTIARRDASGSYARIGGVGAWRSFQWQSR